MSGQSNHAIWPSSVASHHHKLLITCRAIQLAKQDKEDFNAESSNALHDALSGVSEVKLLVEDERDLQSINYMKQVGRRVG